MLLCKWTKPEVRARLSMSNLRSLVTYLLRARYLTYLTPTCWRGSQHTAFNPWTYKPTTHSPKSLSFIPLLNSTQQFSMSIAISIPQGGLRRGTPAVTATLIRSPFRPTAIRSFWVLRVTLMPCLTEWGPTSTALDKARIPLLLQTRASSEA